MRVQKPLQIELCICAMCMLDEVGSDCAWAGLKQSNMHPVSLRYDASLSVAVKGNMNWETALRAP